MTLELGILVSGSGSNLQAILDAVAAGRLDARVRLVVSNRPGVPALARAEAAGVPAQVLDHRRFADREAFDEALADRLEAAGCEWIACAGFMRILGAPMLERFAGRILNVHPALLPSFPGMHAPAQALSAGVRVSGCTVHLVDAGVDTGPILAQAAVPVRPDDDPARLTARIQAQEHRLYPQVLQWIAEGRLRRGETGVYLDAPVGEGALLVPRPEPS
ncbi:MAG: phosphoribosylglycinamide formyltransferase [Deltaproteobacteria bacterium]|nr:MAG: phosphoribosylglycinamide formyltransferase [Deltaproteobacteria bacterium]